MLLSKTKHGLNHFSLSLVVCRRNVYEDDLIVHCMGICKRRQKKQHVCQFFLMQMWLIATLNSPKSNFITFMSSKLTVML